MGGEYRLHRRRGGTRPHDSDSFDRVLQINLVGSFRCLATAAAGMAAQPPLGADGERGVIVNTSSIAAQDGRPGQAAYAASKAGLVGMTLPIARDLMALGIRANVILPGLMDTPALARLTEAELQLLEASVPFPSRLGQPAEFAELVLAIIRNSYLNGEQIRLDGALRMGPRRT